MWGPTVPWAMWMLRTACSAGHLARRGDLSPGAESLHGLTSRLLPRAGQEVSALQGPVKADPRPCVLTPRCVR